ncbi:glycosyltransferase [Alteribacter lacisalsi]|nr:glycosyltransferase [Alteribacter lacisalsi]
MYTVLYVVSTLGRSGPTGQLHNLITNLSGHFRAQVLTLSKEPEDSLIGRFEASGIEVHTLGLSRVESLLSGKKRLGQYITEFQPDAVHTQGIRADSLVASLRLPNHICTVRNDPHEDYLMKFGPLKGRIMARQHVQAVRRIPHPVACSETLARCFREKDIGLFLSSIQNGVNAALYEVPTDDQRKKARRNLGLPEDAIVFVSVGSLIKRKDPLRLIDAFMEIPGEDRVLLMVGDGPLRKDCEARSISDNRIVFTGQTSKVAACLTASDVFVSVSLSEGLPNTVLEAMAAGLPVCLSRIGPHEEILRLGPDAGVLVEPGNTGEICRALLELEAAKEARAGAPRRLIDVHLSAGRMSERYQTKYLEIIEGCG